jgi:hypothetical protein
MIFAPHPGSDHSERTPAQVYGLVFGGLLVGLGVAGFFYSASFATGDELQRDAVLGVIDVNGWANALHLVTGALALAVQRGRTTALAVGVLYVVVAIAGFAAGDGGDILGLLPVNTWGNVAHLMVGAAGIAAWQASARRLEEVAPR